ncbi:hypothetical protein [Streptomyces scopuliridis]|uniref:hypothetical protein n=1 Tax=Streptomyces scopuliridis TaxID=452529 RepID=UPI0036BD13F3
MRTNGDSVTDAVGYRLLPLGDLYIADIASHPSTLRFAAMEAQAVYTRPDAAVQGLVGSPAGLSSATGTATGSPST